jgi:hypothetical protein
VSDRHVVGVSMRSGHFCPEEVGDRPGDVLDAICFGSSRVLG